MHFGRIASLAIAIVAVLGVFVAIPIVSDYAFWILVGAYVVWVGVHYQGSKSKSDWGLSASLVLLIVAIVGVFAEIPLISDYAFWVLLGTYLFAIAITGGLRKK